MKTYTYEGQRVFLAYDNDMPGVKPILWCGNTGCFPVESHNGCSVCAAVDESDGDLFDGEVEIVADRCRNCENGQKLVEGWYTKWYAEIDEIERELCTRTTRYHDWTSDLTLFIDTLYDCSDNGVITRGLAEIKRKSWEDTVKHYYGIISKDNPLDPPDIPTFDDILNGEYIRIEEDEDE